MSALAKADRVKLQKLLAMFSSDHAGERDAAALAAHRLVVQRGLTWGDILGSAPAEHKPPLMSTWRATCAELLQKQGALKPWELGFVRDLPRFRRLSVKQRYVLNEIADRILGVHR